MNRYAACLFFTVILIIGFLIRLYDLDNESLWVDEGQSIQIANQPIPQLLSDISQDNHPPLYSFLLHAWINIFGKSAFAGRFLSLLFAVLTIVVFYRMARLLFDKKIALFSIIFISTSVFHVYFAQEIRSYALLTLLILLSLFYFIQLLLQPRMLHKILYLLFSSLLLYTHYHSVFILLVQNICILIFHVQPRFHTSLKLRVWFLLQFVLLILYLPWLQFFVLRTLGLQESFYLQKPTIFSLAQTFLVYSGTYTFSGVILSAIYCFLVLYALIDFQNGKLKSSFQKKNHQFLILWLLIPILIPYMIASFIAPIYMIKITIGASLAFYLLAACGLAKIKSRKWQAILLVFLISGSTMNLWTYYDETNKERWKEVVSLIDARAALGDMVLANAGFCLPTTFNFYSKREDLHKLPFPRDKYDIAQEDLEHMQQDVAGNNRIWLILSHTRDKEGLLVRFLSKDYRLTYLATYMSRGIYSHKPYPAIEFYLFEKSHSMYRHQDNPHPPNDL